MNLSFNFIKSVSNIYDEMHQNGFSLVYLGEFSHEITKMFSQLTEHDMQRKREEKTVQRKVFHVMVEILQNMNRHSDEISEPTNVGRGLFLIGKKADRYYIISSNKIKSTHREELERILEAVNGASPEELKEMYKQQIKSGDLSQKGGAGLGLIDIARKTGEKLEYQFLPLEPNEYFFILKAEVVAGHFTKE